jgi:predicted dehydrogenase
MRIGIVGLGYWGPNLLRNFSSLENVEYIIGCDTNQDRIKVMKKKFPNVEFTSDINQLFNGKTDAVCIATPVDTHFPIAKRALEAGKHVWLEKPLTSNTIDAQALIRLAEKNNLVLFVDHTFIYTGAVQKIKEIVSAGELGEIIYFDSVRINLGLFQRDVNVTWDLAPHDLSIMNYILSDQEVVAVSADGTANYYQQENIAHLSVHFKNRNCFAHFHVNWTSPVKIRKMIIAGKKKMLIFDDMENSEKIKIYDCGIEMHSTESINIAKVQYRIGDMYSPKIVQTEALSLAAGEFISSINEGRKPLTGGTEGLKVVKILEAADISIKNNGKLVPISDLPENDTTQNMVATSEEMLELKEMI